MLFGVDEEVVCVGEVIDDAMTGYALVNDGV